MGRKIYLIFFIVFFIKNFAFSDVLVSDYAGEVWVRKSPLGTWEELKDKNIKLEDGFAIKTGKGKVKLAIDKSTVWLKENTAFEIESASKFLNAFGLVYGKIKASIKGISPRSRFSIKTITAVCGIRGTDIMMESDVDGKMSVDVLFGEVEFTYLIPPKEGERNFIIPQGVSLKVDDIEKPYNISLITQEKEIEILSNWDPNVKEEERMESLIEKEKDKISLKKFIAYSNNMGMEINNFVYKEKESDFEAGRTFKDINGNTVRIDQRLIRNDLNTIQLFNIIKRKDYKSYDYLTDYSKNVSGFKYNGGSLKDRVDIFAITFSFNKEIPKNIGEWQSFFDRKDVHPEWATFVSANLIDLNNVFFIGEAYKYIENRGELINNTEVIGVPQNTNERDNDVILVGKISKDYLNDIVMYNFREKYTNNPTGELVRKSDPNLNISGSFWGLKVSKDEISDKDLFYQLNITKYLKGANETQGEYFYLCQENYIISNDGNIRKKNDIFSSGKSVSDIIKENAIQSVNYIKKDENGPSNEDYIGAYNTDIIFIGDVPFSIFENTSRGVDRWKD